jgi:signal peptidase I
LRAFARTVILLAMRIEAVPFYGIGVGLILGLAYGFQNYNRYTFEEDENLQHCRPQVTPDQFRWGRTAALLDPDQYEAGQLVRYKINRSTREITSRVVAIQGQTVEIKAGKVMVDDKPLADPYVRGRDKAENFPALLVPKGCVFVLNDQRGRRGGDRRDSRAYGPIPVGAIMLRFAPKDLVKGGRR